MIPVCLQRFGGLFLCSHRMSQIRSGSQDITGLQWVSRPDDLCQRNVGRALPAGALLLLRIPIHVVVGRIGFFSQKCLVDLVVSSAHWQFPAP